MALNSIIALLHPKKWKRKLQAIVLKGNVVHCVCCNHNFDTFLPAGLVLRPNALCPHCGCLERHRALWLFLQQHTDIFTSQKKLLHVAPELVYFKKFTDMPNIEYVPVDKYPQNFGGKKIIEMDITAMQFPDESFDVIICNHVLEHVPDDRAAMREMARVLKKDGWAILNVPVNKNISGTFEDPAINNPPKQLELFGQPDHVRIYGRDYFQRLADAGFKSTVIDFVGSFQHNEQFRLGLQKGEDIIFCKRS